MLNVEKLVKSYQGNVVVQDATFNLGDGQHAALVGYNGTGKSTILKMLAGVEKPDSGTMSLGVNQTVGYLLQDTSQHADTTILEYLRSETGVRDIEQELEVLSQDLSNQDQLMRYGDLQDRFERQGGYNFVHRAEAMLEGLGIGRDAMLRSMTELSSGQKHKVGVVAILLRDDDVLLLDEPTNNLDLPAIIWLEQYLKKSSRTILFVSHDRRFIDHVATKIIVLDWVKRTTSVTNGNYSSYLEQRERMMENQAAAHDRQQKEIAGLERRVETLRVKALRGSSWRGTDNDKFLRGFKRDRAAGSGRRAAAMEKRIEQIKRVERPVFRDPLHIEVDLDALQGSADINLNDVVAGYPNGYATNPISLHIPFGERVSILGTNGAGKSTLLKTMYGMLKPLTGEVKIGPGVLMGNMLQEHESLPRNVSSIEFLMDRCKLAEESAFHLLKRFSILPEDRAREPIANLSPGARARLLIGLFAEQKKNVLVLDEPTNHLDLEASEALEEVLESFGGTILLVSHDRYFLERIGFDRILLLDHRDLKELDDAKEYLKVAEERAQKLIRSL